MLVAATGHLWNSNRERGLYKTTDGGATWTQILYVDDETGCADVAIDPQEPDIIYAAMWQFRRQPHSFSSGGPGSGLYKSVDGGETWERLSTGLPEGDLGRIAITVAASRPNRVYALVESKSTALYRSDDGGQSWQRGDASGNTISRPFYFGSIHADPRDHNRLYRPATTLTVSTDGGKTFSGAASRVHSDHHALWINPANPEHLLVGTDGGLYVSYSGGSGWRHLNNLPISQFYQVGYDLKRPYQVYGGLQDNGSWTGPSQARGAILGKDWTNLGAGDGFHVWPDPTDEDAVYWEWQGGKINRFHWSSGESQSIQPLAGENEADYRFNWNTPFLVSTVEPGVLYLGSQFLLRSNDRGLSWEKLSPDLTTNDPARQRQEESGGLTIDNSTAENHCTIYALSQSPMDAGVLWAGTDDGNLQVTLDGGENWTNLTARVPDLPAGTWVSSIDASPHAAGSATVTFDGHRTGDKTPYVYQTDDHGVTWRSIAGQGLEGYAHVVRQDPVAPELIFVGTEFGLFVTIDGGQQWARFKGNLPPVAVRDIRVHPREGDLILATHGRGLYIIDDLTPLRHLNGDVLEAKAYLLPSRAAIVSTPSSRQRFDAGDWFGQVTPESAAITYYLQKRHIFGDLKVEIYDPQGELLVTLGGTPQRGLNRVQWRMRGKPPRVAAAPTLSGGIALGPMASEGTYRVKLIQGDDSYEGEIRLQARADSSHSPADRQARHLLVQELYAMQDQLAFLAASVTHLRDAARQRVESAGNAAELAQTLSEFAAQLDAQHKTLVATRTGGITGESQLREKVIEVYSAVNGYSGPPTSSQQSRAAFLGGRLQEEEQRYQDMAARLVQLNGRLAEEQLPPLEALTREQFDQRVDTEN